MAKVNDPSRRTLLKCLLPVAVAPAWLVSKGGLAVLEQPTQIITPEEVVDPRKHPWWEASQGAFMLKGSNGDVYTFLGLVTEWNLTMHRDGGYGGDGAAIEGSCNFVGTGGVKVNA